MNTETSDAYIGFLWTCCSEDTHFVTCLSSQQTLCVSAIVLHLFVCKAVGLLKCVCVCAHTKTMLECKERSLHFLCFHLVARYHFLFQGVKNTGPTDRRVSVCVHKHTLAAEAPRISQPVGQWVTNDCFFPCVLVFPCDLSSPKIYRSACLLKKATCLLASWRKEKWILFKDIRFMFCSLVNICIEQHAPSSHERCVWSLDKNAEQ